MSDPTEELLFFNAMGHLADLLSAEEHVEDLESKEVAHSWCLNKHLIRADRHHLKEFVSHCSRHPQCREQVLPQMKEYKKDFEKELLDPVTKEGKSIEVDVIAKYRNRFRVLVQVLFPSLAKDNDECPICSLDRDSQMVWLEKQAGEKASA